MHLPFETCDVFTGHLHGGNPLAVVHGGEGLPTATLQAVAREFALSETVFVLAQGGGSARIRIFTPAIEMPFAGHPNVGTAVLLARRLGLASGTLQLDQPAGRVAARIEGDTAEIEAPKPFAPGPALDPAGIAACAGLEAGALLAPPVLASCGAAFAIAEVTEAALAAAAPDPTAFRAALPVERATGLHLVARLGPGRLRVRMFGPLAGVAEDPATGSANVALGGLLLHQAGGDRLALEVEQGIEMARPSLLHVTAYRDPAGAIRVRVGGQVVPVSEGRVRVA